MRYIGFFTPQSVTSGTFDMKLSHGKVKFSNESSVNLLLTFSDGQTAKLPAGVERLFCIVQPNTTVSWAPISVLNLPSSVDAVDVEVYDPSDTVDEKYPHALSRQAIIGNPSSISGGNVSQLINDGNALQNIIESTKAGDPGSSWVGTNAGDVTIACNIAGVMVNLLQLVGTGAPSNRVMIGTVGLVNTLNKGNFTVSGSTFCQDLQSTTLETFGVTTLGDGPHLTETKGDLQVDGNAILNSNKILGTGNVLWIDFSNNFDLKLIANGGNVLVTGGIGLLIFQGVLTFNNGKTISKIGDANGVGSGTFNHNMGATPDHISITTHVNGSQTVGYDSENSTQFHVTTGAGLAWLAFLTKRS